MDVGTLAVADTPAATEPGAGVPAPAAVRPRGNAERHIRGSSLLLAGRVLSRGTNFLVQVLIVRYLTVTEYGGFAYALSIVSAGQTIATCGLDKAVSRFVPLYQERRDFDRLFGTLLLVTGVVLSLGLAFALALHGFGASTGPLLDDPGAQAVLLILVFLVPLQAIDDLIVGLFAVFAHPAAIFFRRHVLAPGLKLAVVLLLVFTQSTIFFLAVGYVLASLVGVAVYGVMLVRLLRADGLLGRWATCTVRVPWRDLAGFTGPLLVSDLVLVVMHTLTVVLLQFFHGLDAVAMFRAQQPIAAVNQIVMVSFATLFTPTASRLFARGDRHGVNALYWRTAMWIAVLSFPIFALTCSLAGPTTRMLLGPRYQESATLLALLAIGYYFNAALGFNGLTLKIYGRVCYVLVISVVTVLIGVAASIALIPFYGALGAAIATCLAMIVHNVLKQTGLRLGTGIDVFDWGYLRGYVVILLSAAGVWALARLADVPFYWNPIAAAVGTWLVFRCNRHLLDLEQTFPEVRRVPLLRRLVGVPAERN